MTRQERRVVCNGLLFAAPWLAGFVLLIVYPLGASLYYSLCRFNAIQPPVWVGLRNYADLFLRDPLFWKSLYNTLYFTTLSVPLSLAFSLGLALLLVPLGIYLANKMETGWISEIVTSQTWALQKGLVIVLSIVALTVSGLRTALVFDKKKAKLFEEYEQQEAEARNARKALKNRRR